MTSDRHVFGIDALDRGLGGGVLPGTLTVIAGATGVGKTQLGLQWANAGLSDEGRRGVLCDLTSRGDSQNHRAYASRLFGWELSEYSLTATPDFERVWDFARTIGDYFHPFDRAGRRVTRARPRSRGMARMENRSVAHPALFGRFFLSTFRAGPVGLSSTDSSRPSVSASRSSSSFSSTSTTNWCARTTNGPRASGFVSGIAPMPTR